jgi:hypothetical protein
LTTWNSGFCGVHSVFIMSLLLASIRPPKPEFSRLNTAAERRHPPSTPVSSKCPARTIEPAAGELGGALDGFGALQGHCILHTTAGKPG